MLLCEYMVHAQNEKFDNDNLPLSMSIGCEFLPSEAATPSSFSGPFITFLLLVPMYNSHASQC